MGLMREVIAFVAGIALVAALLLFAFTSHSFGCAASEPLEHRLMRHEGVRACAYTDTLGNPTIGIGHLLKRPFPEPMCWTPSKVRMAFEADLESARRHAKFDVGLGSVWRQIGETRRGVLIELTFQLGTHGLARFRKMLVAIHAGDYKLAAQELIRSRLHHQAPARTHELACLLEHGG